VRALGLAAAAVSLYVVADANPLLTYGL